MLALARAGATEEAARALRGLRPARRRGRGRRRAARTHLQGSRARRRRRRAPPRGRRRRRSLRGGVRADGWLLPGGQRGHDAARGRGRARPRDGSPRRCSSSSRPTARTPTTRPPPKPRRTCFAATRRPPRAALERAARSTAATTARSRRRAASYARSVSCGGRPADPGRARRSRRGPLLRAPDRGRARTGTLPGRRRGSGRGANRRGGRAPPGGVRLRVARKRRRHPLGRGAARAGSELHVVLPFAREEFVALSVASSGADWVERFDRCLPRRRRFATRPTTPSSATTCCSATAPSWRWDSRCCVLAISTPRSASSRSGTAGRRAGGRDRDRRRELAAPAARHVGHARASARVRDPSAADPYARSAGGRSRTGRAPVVRAMLFGDVKGFSKLTDEQLPVFAAHVLGAFAERAGAPRRRGRSSQHLGRCRLRRALRRVRGSSLRARAAGGDGGDRSRGRGAAVRISRCASARMSVRSSRRTIRCSTRTASWGRTSAAPRASSR